MMGVMRMMRVTKVEGKKAFFVSFIKCGDENDESDQG